MSSDILEKTPICYRNQERKDIPIVLGAKIMGKLQAFFLCYLFSRFSILSMYLYMHQSFNPPRELKRNTAMSK